MGTVAFYGPDDKCASKVSVGVILEEDGEPESLERWSISAGDIRADLTVLDEIVEFLKSHGVKSIAMTARVIGCPHEEGKDYPAGDVCPECQFWANRDRWTGETIQ